MKDILCSSLKSFPMRSLFPLVWLASLSVSLVLLTPLSPLVIETHFRISFVGGCSCKFLNESFVLVWAQRSHSSLMYSVLWAFPVVCVCVCVLVELKPCFLWLAFKHRASLHCILSWYEKCSSVFTILTRVFVNTQTAKCGFSRQILEIMNSTGWENFH